MKNLELSKGLEISLEILKRLKKRKDLIAYVSIGTFTNCREVGLTYQVTGYYDKKTYKCLPIEHWFTFCTYEHRNSDEIIINGKRGLISHNGDLPYKGDKWEYFECLECGDYDSATTALVYLMNKVVEDYLTIEAN